MREELLTWEQDYNQDGEHKVEEYQEGDRHVQGLLRLLQLGLQHQTVATPRVLQSRPQFLLKHLVFDVLHQVDWQFTFVLPNVPVSTSHQESSHGSATFELLRTLDGQVERGVAIHVLHLESGLAEPAEEVDECDL